MGGDIAKYMYCVHVGTQLPCPFSPPLLFPPLFLQLNNAVSGALDRLHYEKDPCVRYDSPRKVWIYLHRGRSEEDFGEIELHVHVHVHVYLLV